MSEICGQHTDEHKHVAEYESKQSVKQLKCGDV